MDPSLVTADYHPSADTARDQLTRLKQKVDQLKKKLEGRDSESKKQQAKVYYLDSCFAVMIDLCMITFYFHHLY